MFSDMQPPLPDLPEIRDQTVSALRRQDAIAMRMPALRGPSAKQLFGYSPAQVEAERYAAAMRIAFEIYRRQAQISAAEARARDRGYQRLAERRRAWWR
nr:hypothetical protein 103 [Pelagibacteraceae bacterium]